MTAARTVFRPRATVAVCVGLTVAFVAGAGLLLVLLARSPDVRAGHVVGVLVVAVGTVTVCALLGRVRAVADDDGLVVRNPVSTHRLAWAQVLAVRLGRERPWVELDLADGSTLPVLAIQASDGERAQAQARQLRALVAAHEGHEPPR